MVIDALHSTTKRQRLRNTYVNFQCYFRMGFDLFFVLALSSFQVSKNPVLIPGTETMCCDKMVFSL